MTGAKEILKDVSKTGRINLMDRFLVIDKCKQLGYIDTAKWISENPRAYAKLIIEGALEPYLAPPARNG